MGRQKCLKRKLSKRHKGKSKPAKPHESEPEKLGVHNEDDQESLAWDSLDEIKLPPTPSGAEYLPSPDEMEVTRKFSCLNFSMIPCPASAMVLEPDHVSLECQETVDCTRADPMVTDLNSTAVDVLPSLSDRETTFGCRANRQSRKRPSRRKPNKRIKKSRHSLNPRESSLAVSKHSLPQQPLFVSFVRPTPKDPYFSRGRSFRRPRQRKSTVEDDPLLCFFSDTSAVCDVEGHLQERMDDMFDFTPPGEQCVSGVRLVEGCGDGEAELIDSDLSESSTSDSGCEGDDEESSVEGPTPRPNQKSPSWPGRGSYNDSSSEDENFSRILEGAFPLMSAAGQTQFQNQLYQGLSEFKHPGRFGVCARGGRKKRCKPPQPSKPLSLMDVNQRLVKFVQNNSENELKFNLVSRALCRTISSLANVYNLDCYIEQKRRLPVASPLLRKSLLTRLPSMHEIEPILRNHGRESPTMLFRESFTGRGRMDTTETRTHPQMPRPHVVVGEGVPPLSESNVGNQILQNMGWRPGTGLGLYNSGIKVPVRAEVRPKKTGLGY